MGKKIEIAKSHIFSGAVNGLQISPYMQEKMVYAGQSGCYAESQEIVPKYQLKGNGKSITRKMMVGK